MESMKEILERLARSIASQESSTQNPPDSPTSECAACGDTGFVRAGNGMVECACAVERRVTARLPPDYRLASLLDVPPAVQNFVLDWFAKPGQGLFIVGPTGRGKTHLAAAIVRTLVMLQYEAFFLRCADLYADLRETYQTDTSERAVYARYSKYRYLVLDDIGAGGLSDFQRYSVTEFLDQRINRRAPTIVTSNWGLEQIAEKMDERIASRISSFACLELTGEDRRPRGFGGSR
jgi:chromosomal replication initiation ATPase DnaA